MKRMILISLLVILPVLTAFVSMGKEKKHNRSENREIEKLWEDYASAEEAQRPQKMTAILEDIKAAAGRSRSAWDYYKACTRYIDVASMRNWKLRDSLEAAFRQEILTYDEPLLTVLMMLDDHTCPAASVLDYIHSHSENLKKACNEDVYCNRTAFPEANALNSMMPPLIEDDYEYALWEMLGKGAGEYGRISLQVLDELKAIVKEDYPKRGIAEWIYAVRYVPETDGRLYDYMARLQNTYRGKALSLLPRQWMLRHDFMELEAQEAGSSSYEALRESLIVCEKERKSYARGIDSEIAAGCNGFEVLLDALTKKGVALTVEDGKAVLALRNLARIKVRIKKGKNLMFEEVFDNPRRSFYAYDTLRFDIPVMDDGGYTLECVDGMSTLGTCVCERYSLSLATREHAEGIGVYVADYLSGKPVDSVDLRLYKGDRLVAEAKDFRIDGFSPLPEAFVSRLDSRSSGCYMEAYARDDAGRQILSPKVYISASGFSVPEIYPHKTAVIMTDRSAFNPGDSLRFKAVAYDVEGDGEMHVLDSAARLVVKLLDPQGKSLSEKSFVTNAFGSCAGEFALDGIERDGVFTLAVFADGKRIGSKRVRVDEFVLPSFDLSFDESNELYLPGDTISISGRLVSFSGHPLSSVKAELWKYKDGLLVSENPLALSSDGTFRFSFAADCGKDEDYASYELKVRITDATGETLEFSRFESVSRYIALDVRLENHSEGVVTWPKHITDRGQCRILADERADVCFSVRRNDGRLTDSAVKYEIISDGKVLEEAEAVSGVVEHLDFSDLPSGLYSIVARASLEDGYGREIKTERILHVMKVNAGDTVMNAPVENMIHVLSDDSPSVMFGVGNGPVWALFELFTAEGRLLQSEVVHLEGLPGKETSLAVRKYGFDDTVSAALSLNVFYFHNGRKYSWTHVWRRPQPATCLPLEITRFTDKTAPSAECTIGLRTASDSEVLAAVFDLSSEKIMPNVWNQVLKNPAQVARVNVRAVTGRNSSGYRVYLGEAGTDNALMEDAVTVACGGRGGAVFRNMAFASAAKAEVSVESEDMVSVEEEAVAEPEAAGHVREDFSTTLAFEPFLYPDDEGKLDLTFRTSDKLSTFVLSLFAHDRQMKNAVYRRDMLVTLPVKISLVQPQYLYQGDRYVLRASVSNNSGSAMRGEVLMEAYDGSDYAALSPLSVRKTPLALDAGSLAEAEFEVDVPAADTLGFRLIFTGGFVSDEKAVHEPMMSDAVFVTVPVLPSRQTLIETHSAVLLPDMPEEELTRSLRDRFVNVSSIGAEYSQLSIMDMLREALPLVVEAEGRDLVSQSAAMYVNLLGGSLRASDPRSGGPSAHEYAVAAMTAVRKILACANADGGFGWFEGMTSSPVVTAVLLERYAGLRDRGVLSLMSEELGEDALEELSEAVSSAVRYLDKTCFDRSGRPIWYGGLSQLQYMSLRSMYAGIPFEVAPARVKEVLKLKKEDWGTEGSLLAKARVIRILSSLNSSEKGKTLASAWGLKNTRKLERFLDAEICSLLEYVVEHPSGGMYCPNAVLPWRGLLESEAYAHAYIADLMKELHMDEIADGIRIWLMVQKETQQWQADPGFVDALASVYDARQMAEAVKVIVLKKRYEKPFEDIKAAGNGMDVTVKYYKELPAVNGYSLPQRILLNEGDSFEVGDRIIAVYSLWSEENRSFVRLSVPRAALFRPENQLSGWSGGGIRPISYAGFGFSPYCYREVKADRTLYWLDVFPEEKTSFEEILFVTQKGRFTSAAAEFECLYAPHYRANEGGGRRFITIF